jgi:hypothetical protein
MYWKSALHIYKMKKREIAPILNPSQPKAYFKNILIKIPTTLTNRLLYGVLLSADHYNVHPHPSFIILHEHKKMSI